MYQDKYWRGFGGPPARWVVRAIACAGMALLAQAASADDVENLAMSQSVPDHIAFDSLLDMLFAGDDAANGRDSHMRNHIVAEAIGAEATDAGAARMRVVQTRLRKVWRDAERAREQLRVEIYCSDEVADAPYRTLVQIADRMDLENSVINQQQYQAGLAVLKGPERAAMHEHLADRKKSISYLQISIDELLQRQRPDLSEAGRRDLLRADLQRRCAAVSDKNAQKEARQ